MSDDLRQKIAEREQEELEQAHEAALVDGEDPSFVAEPHQVDQGAPFVVEAEGVASITDEGTVELRSSDEPVTQVKVTAGPKEGPLPVSITFVPKGHKYTVNGEDYPSVTQILEATMPKDALPWWAMRVGMAGIVAMFQDNEISFPQLIECVYDEVVSGKPAPERAHFRPNDKKRAKPKTYIEAALQNSKLDINAVRKRAADRGTSMHDEVVKIGLADALTSFDDVAEELRPYLQAFSRFWFNEEPEIIEQEVLLASLKHRYAGRLDLIAGMRGAKGVVDFKTTTNEPTIYDNHHAQVVLYKVGYEEMTGIDLDFAAVVSLSDTGDYGIEFTWGTPEMFLPKVADYYGFKAFEQARPGKRK